MEGQRTPLYGARLRLGARMADLGGWEMPLRYAGIAADVAAAGVRCLLSCTGCTGEDGFELYCSPADAGRLFETLLEAGAVPAGLGAPLRLEAALPLYGNELTGETAPLEAGLSRFVCFDKGEFSGRAALVRRLAGFEPAGSLVWPTFLPGCPGRNWRWSSAAGSARRALSPRRFTGGREKEGVAVDVSGGSPVFPGA